ncbi:MAG: ribonuclease [Hyphomicrobiales bacterium]|nr:ribonuclease [Hyphomicrobiales bacterium]
MKLRFALAVFALASLSGTAEAQWSGGRPQRGEPCLLDRCGDREPARKPDGAREPSREDARPGARAPSSVAPGAFDFYLLALSWSPSFCALGGAEKAREQCGSGAARGFVVHGLWPQNERGFPADCDHPVRNPPRAAMEAARGVFPEEGLARYEWRKHGTCSGRSPAEYFAEVGRARDRVQIPDSLRAPERTQSLDPQDVQRAFIDANRGLRPGMMAVTCQRGLLQEVRVCMSKDLREFRACPEVARAACRTRDIAAPAAR